MMLSAQHQLYHQHRHSSSSSSAAAGGASFRKRAAATPLAPLAAVLEQLSLRVAAVRLSKRDVRYELQVEHSASQTRWRRARSLDEYKAFQTQLLAALRLGHFCQAECPWLYTFVKSYFPGSVSLFGLGGHSDCAVEKRRDALEHVLTSLQKFVVNRQNAAGCSIVAGRVTQLVVDFVLGDVSDKRHPLNGLCGSTGSGNSFNLGSLRDSVCSSTSVTSDEGDEMADEAEDAGVCTLCNSSLDGEAFGASTSSSETDSFRSTSSRRSSVLSYTTTLSCGHQFHDECIVSKLNEEMRCPTCHAEVDSF
ncbi:hypothetical protein PRIC1_004197 [Phytophthora ramorum]|uniref:RING-type domain-containing protein n=2 Tax=Phytophthora ramorum TaxID=164328 RepID=H3GYR2_PHYRM|nr:hypothetical protein KRP23_3938 [Phytophthora ramorum]KAH7484885.1 hypothetical protein KRP23_3939 [Phytophthora ramorum]KAH7507718.1 hypothetical protein KRP22_2818 [Phytophthora ramorum]KAH7507719.1 hypothetical protein KRP22_2819 [Phytophthora ramorum]